MCLSNYRNSDRHLTLSFFNLLVICYRYATFPCHFCAFLFCSLSSLPVFLSIFICIFITLTVTYKTLKCYSDNDIMTGYTCYDYHHDGSLILCSVYYLHQGLVMLYTDRSVIRRTARSHLSMPFYIFSFTPQTLLYLALSLCYLHTYISVAFLLFLFSFLFLSDIHSFCLTLNIIFHILMSSPLSVSVFWLVVCGGIC